MLRSLIVWVLTLSALRASAAGQTAPAYRVKDLNPGVESGSIAIYDKLVPHGDAVYFGAVGPGSGEQLWRSDGTAEGTRKLRDFDVLGYPPPEGFASLGSRLFFFVDGGLWQVDGAGQPILVTKLPSSARPSAVAVAGSHLFFTIDDGAHGVELWKSDGTSDGTSLLADIEPGAESSWPSMLTAVGDTLFFFTYESRGGYFLWRTDGTASGTQRVKGLPGPGVGDGVATSLSGLLVFIARETENALAFHLWRSDGTPEGTFPLADFVGDSGSVCPGWCFPYGPSDLTPLGNIALFIANDGTHGRELWRTDGTTAGTRLVKDVFPGEEAGAFSALIRAGGLIFFTGQVPVHGYQLWKSDGSEAGTGFVGVNDAYPLVAFENRLFFTVDGVNQLFSTDGTANGTMTVYDFGPSPSTPYLSALAPLGDALLFVRSDANGSTLWRTDGTPSGTFVVDDFASGASSSPAFLTDAAGRLFFSVAEGVYPNYYRTLWTSDGTEAGTSAVATFMGFEPASLIANSVAAIGGDFYFSANDGVHGVELWKSNGTSAGTVLVKDIATPTPDLLGWFDSYPSGMTVMGSTLFFTAADADHGFELWRTDGTEAGTTMVKDTLPGFYGGMYGDPPNLTRLGGLLFVTANDGVHGGELWRSDGTESGTFMVKDIHPGPDWSSLFRIVVAGGRLFFSAYDGIGNGIWTSDGTQEGTVKLASFDGPIGGDLTAGGSLVYFTTFGQTELWRSDGTETGTFGIQSIAASNLTWAGDTLFFTADDGVHGVELWATDGTEAGTRMVGDLRAGPSGSTPRSLTNIEGALVFSANDEAHGAELWVSDGTVARMLQNIAPGPSSSSPSGFVRSGDRVFFSANDGITGVELWAIPLRALFSFAPRELVPLQAPARATRGIQPRD